MRAYNNNIRQCDLIIGSYVDERKEDSLTVQFRVSFIPCAWAPLSAAVTTNVSKVRAAISNKKEPPPKKKKKEKVSKKEESEEEIYIITSTKNTPISTRTTRPLQSVD